MTKTISDVVGRQFSRGPLPREVVAVRALGAIRAGSRWTWSDGWTGYLAADGADAVLVSWFVRQHWGEIFTEAPAKPAPDLRREVVAYA